MKMDNLDDSENNAKISDSAYSTSCSNSQSRRSHSSKSTHSGSNSSGSSGYGGKPASGYGSNNLNQPPEKRLKEKEKKKKSPQTELKPTKVQTEVDCRPPVPVKEFEEPKQQQDDVSLTPAPSGSHAEKGAESMDTSNSDKMSCKDETRSCHTPVTTLNIVASHPSSTNHCQDSFSCVISMNDGVVMYTTASITTILGFPKEMWIGRSFLDFVHTRDRNLFASQITSGLAVPKNLNALPRQPTSPTTMVCRIRRYRDLSSGFGVKTRTVAFMPFLLRLSFKKVTDDDGDCTYLVIQATPFYSAFKLPNEVITKSVPFVIRHAANGNVEYIDPESVPYLGYIPQDLVNQNVLQLYHPHDLDYLQRVYEVIVREGGLARSNSFRMMTQNGDFIKLETEWSSFINPWSRKLEFVIGKHHVLEGPTNPDVFRTPECDAYCKFNDEEKVKAQCTRDAIIRIMNEVLTKPAEAAKQQMSKRCQDVAAFMETLMEEAPKNDEDLGLEIQEADHSYYERDSVMLGGISPHHDYNDSKSSTETPISYNQLNYNDTLQRYFDSHQSYPFEDSNTVSGENVFGLKDPKDITRKSLSPLAKYSSDSTDLGSSSDSNTMAVANFGSLVTLDYTPMRLTESLLDKHNVEMEKKLVKMHRENRISSKTERERAETRQKKKEHIARCNAAYQPTNAVLLNPDSQPHGLKRSSKQIDMGPGPHKHHCSSQRQTRRWQPNHPSTSSVPQPTSNISNTTANAWPTTPGNSVNTFFLGVGIPQPMSIVSSMNGVSGMFPMYYAPSASTSMGPNPGAPNGNFGNNSARFHQSAMPCMMYGQPMYGSPFMYSPITPQVTYAMPENFMNPNMQYNSNNVHPLELARSNYEEACKPSVQLKTKPFTESWRDKKMADSHATPPNTDQVSGSNCSVNALKREMEPLSDNQSVKRKLETLSSDIKSADSFSPKVRVGRPSSTTMENLDTIKESEATKRGSNTDDVVDKTDGESSYSSFYSSFFKTESGSAEESDAKRGSGSKDDKSYSWAKKSQGDDMPSMLNSNDMGYNPMQKPKKVMRRKMEPPWMEQVCVTSELIYRYQVLTKSMEEVLNADKQRMKNVEQPTLVNEQLGQLYLDLQLEGVAARLTLEEGLTSSSSSGEETAVKPPKSKYTTRRKKHEYSKLVMIYEEDAPLPPPDAGSSSTS
ncbi:period circadian protein-like isoform X2 [Epargyreus clarus]|uniref:period circadian protein-like isoform X2 n=1 Tax=Epargyreus clarus TaxID=520877 RepID=UPI003C2B537A